MRRRILLINPLAPYSAQGFAPLAIATVAGITPGRYEVSLWDEIVSGPAPLRSGPPPDLVGLSVTFPYQAERALEIARLLRDAGVPVVVGGAYLSSNPAQFRGKADAILVGEAEVTWPRMLDDWEADGLQPEYRQITPPSLDQAPRPRWDTLRPGFARRYSRGSVQTTRGCPFDCEFCDVIYIYGRTQRHKPVPGVIDEIREQRAMGMDRVFLADDAFEANRKYARELLDALIPVNNAWDRPLAFEVQCGVRVASHPDLLERIADANFELLWMGVESPDDSALQSINKLQNAGRDLGADLRRIAAAGIGVAGYMIVGLDGDDEGTFDRQLRYWKEARLIVPIVNILTAVPHTKLWLRLAQEGRIVATPGQREGVVDLMSNIVPKRMSRRRLLEGYRQLLAEAADWSAFADRVADWAGAVERVPRVPGPALPDAAIRDRRAALQDPEARRAFDRVIEAARARDPVLARRVLGFVDLHEGRSRFLTAFHLPQLRDILRSGIALKRSTRVRWSVPIPPAFRAAFRTRLLPPVLDRLSATLGDPGRMDEALTEVFVEYLTRFAPEHGAFAESDLQRLAAIADKVTARLNRGGEGPVAAAPPLRAAEVGLLADRVLKAVGEDLIRSRPALHAPQQDPVFLG